MAPQSQPPARGARGRLPRAALPRRAPARPQLHRQARAGVNELIA